MANDALHANPSNIPITITEHGSDFLYAVFALMLFCDIGVFLWGLMVPKGRRVFHQLAMIILTTAAIAYFAMASNLGGTGVTTEFNGGGRARAVWWVRYVDWFVTTPCLLLELLFATGLPLGDIITLIFFDEVMIITGLVGGLVVSSYKWGFFAFGCAALVYIWYVLIGPARTSCRALGPDFHKEYVTSAAILSVLWLLYPIAWGLADGSNSISPDGEMVFYGVLDILAKPVFCAWHLWSVSKLDYTKLQLQSGKFSETATDVAAFDAEKRFAGEGTTGTKGGMFRRNKVAAHADAPAAPRMSEATQVAHE